MSMEKHIKEGKSMRGIHFDDFLEFLIVAALNALVALWITAGVSLSHPRPDLSDACLLGYLITVVSIIVINLISRAIFRASWILALRHILYGGIGAGLGVVIWIVIQ